MRLLFVSHSFPPKDRPLASIGGMQRVAVELAEALPAHADVSFLVLRSAWRWHHLQCALWLWPTLWRIWRKIRRGEVDAILFSSMVTGALVLFLRRALARRDVVAGAIVHGKDVTQPGLYQWLLVRHILRALNVVMPVSQATGAECIRRGMPASHVHVIPNGVQAARFQAPATRTGNAAAGPVDRLLLCSVGRLVRRKGFAWFVRAVMPQLPPRVHYEIGGNGPERGSIARAIEERGLGDRVRLLGRLSESALVRLYGQADLLIVPNIPVPGDMEGFGIVMLEAGACGTPALAARLEGIQDVITEGTNGHLIASGDAAGFVNAVTRLHEDAKALRDLGISARNHTLRHFRWEAVSARYVKALKAVQRT